MFNLKLLVVLLLISAVVLTTLGLENKVYIEHKLVENEKRLAEAPVKMVAAAVEKPSVPLIKLERAKLVNDGDKPGIMMPKPDPNNAQVLLNSVPEEQNKDTGRIQLPPIMPSSPFFANLNLPPFIQNLLGSKLSVRPLGLENNEQANAPADQADVQSADSAVEQQRPHGLITILLMKTNNKDSPMIEQQSSSSSDDASSGNGIIHRTKLILFKFLPTGIFTGGDEANAINGINRPQMMLGADDIDRKQFELQQQQQQQQQQQDSGIPSPFKALHLFGSDNLDKLHFKLFESLNGLSGNDDDNDDDDDNNDDGNDSLPNSDENSDEIDSGKAVDPSADVDRRHRHRHHHHRHRHHHHHPHPHSGNPSDDYPSSLIIRTDDGSPAFISNDIGQNIMNDHRPPPNAIKKCMMLNFMRLKASVYYKTIIHLLFITGTVLFALFMFILTVRLFKRRRALRYYRNGGGAGGLSSVATVDGLVNGEKSNNGCKFTLRFGNIRKSDEEFNAGLKSSSLLISAPPAYDQCVIRGPVNDSLSSVKVNSPQTRSSLINSLANAYKNRYQKARRDSDTKSVSSLPAYEDALLNNSTKPTDQI